MITDQEIADLFKNNRLDFYKRLLMILKNENDIDDVIQNAFINCWESESKEHVKKSKNWVYQILYNCAKKFLTNKKYDKPICFSEYQNTNEFEYNPNYEIENEEIKELVKLKIEKIPKRQKEFLILSEKMSFTEISKQYNVPIGTVKTLIRRAKIKLTKIINKKTS